MLTSCLYGATPSVLSGAGGCNTAEKENASRKLYLLLVMTMALSLSSAALAEGDTYWTELDSLNGSEASGPVPA